MKPIPYGRQFIDDRDVREVVKVLRSDWITQGSKIEEFEDALKRYCGARYAVAISSGTAALHIACLAAGLKAGDEVITSPITFAATANSVLYTGARPVFADINVETANIDPEKIVKNITRKTRVILPVHFAGLPCDMRVISRIARKNKLVIIEDACHALGAGYEHNSTWARVGSCRHSDMAVFSFHPVKSITTGEGGAVLTNHKDLYDKLIMLRNHGITKDDKKFNDKKIMREAWYYEMQCLGFNYRITDFQCALGISQLKKIEGFITKRTRIAEGYDKCFKGNPYFDLPGKTINAKSSWHLYPIRLKNKYIKFKKYIFETLRQKGIGVQVHYLPVYLHSYYEGLGYKKGDCLKAEEFYKREISMPIYPLMGNKEIGHVVKAIFKTFEEM